METSFKCSSVGPVSSFLRPEEVLRKTSFKTDYCKERPDVDYTTFGEPCKLEIDKDEK